MDLNTIADALVQTYAYTTMVGGGANPDDKVMSGGLPIETLVGGNTYIVQSGGMAKKQNGYPLQGMENKAIPIGLVYQPNVENRLIDYIDGRVPLDTADSVIPNDLYDKLLSAISVSPTHADRGTRKHKHKD